LHQDTAAVAADQIPKSAECVERHSSSSGPPWFLDLPILRALAAVV